MILNLCIQLFKLTKYLQTKSMDKIFIHIILLQASYIAFNFMFIFIYSPLMIAGYLLRIGFSFIRVSKFQLNTLLLNYQIIIKLKSKQSKEFINSYSKHIELKLINYLRDYSGLIIFTENVQIVLSKLFLCALLVTFVASQITMNCLKNLSTDSTVIIIFMYYFLTLDYIIILLLSYIVSKFNANLNSICKDLNRIVCCINEMARSKRSQFKIMLIYERLVNKKPFGIKIGPITVLTKAVFIKVSLVNL